MIDTHSHLLPGLDHGCPDIETSVQMARAAAEAGVQTIVCTPHFTEWDEAFVRRAGEVIEEVREALAAADVDVALRLGFEVDLTVAATVDVETLRALAIEDSGGAILLEVPYSGWMPAVDEIIFQLSAAGLMPVLAHPERNDRIQKSSENLVRCLRAGAVAQGTAGSLGGIFGSTAERAFFRLLEEGLVSLLASDAHAFIHGGWTMGPMLDALAGRVSPDDLVTLTETNPGLLLAGERPRPIGPQPKRSRTLWPRAAT
ncbi:MAG: hypothetical protein JXA87_05295 [Thermoleophilia bacterium]|nr:hypothetical protein [Thermoleophilia bacterium]